MHMQKVLQAAMLLQRWDVPRESTVALPPHVIRHAYAIYTRMKAGSYREYNTRAGVPMLFHCSRAAMEAACGVEGIRAGLRFKGSLGEGTVIGERDGAVWYVFDADQHAWYWDRDELKKLIKSGGVTLLTDEAVRSCCCGVVVGLRV